METLMTYKLSSRQFAFLRHLSRGDRRMNNLQALNQTTFRSILYRGYAVGNQAGGANLTEAGAEALESFLHGDVPLRKDETRMLSRTVVELLRNAARRRVHQTLRRRGA
jgi:hypothetical protein